jgi:hypothetical protein
MLRRIAELYGFCLQKGFFGPKINGIIQDYHIAIRPAFPWRGFSYRISITVPHRYPFHISLKSQFKKSNIKRPSLAGKVITGDKEFDGAVVFTARYIPGATGLMDADTRWWIVKAMSLSSGLFIYSNKLLCRLNIKGLYKVKTVGRFIIRLLSISKRLKGEISVMTMLLNNIHNDSFRNVMIRNLDIMVSHFASHPALSRALMSCLDHPVHEVRYKAACLLGKRGIQGLYSLLNTGDTYWKIQSISAIVLIVGSEAIPRLLDCYMKNQSPEIRKALLKAFEKGADQRIHPLLVQEIQSGTIDNKTIAIRILGNTGGKGEIPLLRAVAFDRTVHLALRSLALRSIDKIKTRLGLDAGMLSVTVNNGESGSLSMVQHHNNGLLSEAENDN